MLNKPILFVLINLFLTFLCLNAFGFKSIYVVMFIVSLIIFFTNVNKIGLCNSLSLLIVYLMIFDSPFFTFTSLSIRIWYPIELLLLIINILKLLVTNSYNKRNNIYFCLCYVFLLVLTLCFLLMDPVDAKLYIIKNLVFYLGTIIVLTKSFTDMYTKISTEKLLSFFISIGLYVSIWGIIQYYSWNSGYAIHGKFQYDYRNIRPSGFFSETTWYAEYLLFSLILVYYMYQRTKKKFFIFLLIPLFYGIFLSSTRNAYFAFGIIYLATLFADIYRGKINKNFFYIILVFILGLIFLLIKKTELFTYIYLRFVNGDSGRLEAFTESINRIKEHLFFGHGFTYNYLTDIKGNGTSIGAKSFNIFLWILHIFGLIGFIPFIVIIINYFHRLFLQCKKNNLVESKISLCFISGFLAISMFAPLHQFPIGMFIVSISISLFTYVDKMIIIDELGEK